MRLNRVVSRFVEFRNTQTDDLRFFWAAYRKGAFVDLEEIPDGLAPQEFVEVFFDRFEMMGLAWMWTHLAEAEGEYRPVGVTMAWARGRVIEICDSVWFPWASPRNVFEASTNFFNTMRKSAPDPNKPDSKFVVLEYAQMSDKKFFERIQRLGVIRKVGHIHGIYPKEPAVLFETSQRGL